LTTFAELEETLLVKASFLLGNLRLSSRTRTEKAPYRATAMSLEEADADLSMKTAAQHWQLHMNGEASATKSKL
jgi:hypothetical protein